VFARTSTSSRMIVVAGMAAASAAALSVAFAVALLVCVGALAAEAAPAAHRAPAPYGGIGATVAQFKAAHATAPGRPPAGTTYYRIDQVRNGRVMDYHVVVGWKSARTTTAILARLSGNQLPRDAKLVMPYNGFCATYRSPWLGRVIGLSSIQVSAPTHAWWNGVWAARGPVAREGCRG
jgi:hypothetical protein